MLVYGYAKECMYAGDGTFHVKVRIPSIHGPYTISSYQGNHIRNYVPDSELPYYQSVLLPHLPTEGEVVALMSRSDKNSEFIIIGLTGGSYQTGLTSI